MAGNDRRVVYTFDGEAPNLAAILKQIKTLAGQAAAALDSVNKAARGESRASSKASKVADQAKLLKAQNALLAQQVRNQKLLIKSQEVNNSSQAAANARAVSAAKAHQSAMDQVQQREAAWLEREKRIEAEKRRVQRESNRAWAQAQREHGRRGSGGYGAPSGFPFQPAPKPMGNRSVSEILTAQARQRKADEDRAWREYRRAGGGNAATNYPPAPAPARPRHKAAPSGANFGRRSGPSASAVNGQRATDWREYESGGRSGGYEFPAGFPSQPAPRASGRKTLGEVNDAIDAQRNKAAERAAKDQERSNRTAQRAADAASKRQRDFLTHHMNRSLNALQMPFKRMFDMTGALLFFQTIRNIQAGISSAVMSMVDFNRQIENSRLGMASTTTAAGQFVDKYGKALPIAEQVNIALREADSLIPKLLEASAKRGLNFEGMLSASTAVAGFTRAAGFSEQERIDVVTGIVALSQKLNISQGQIVKTIDNVIKGVRVQNTELGSTLGITSKQVKNWREQGTLAKELLKVLQGTQEASERSLDTITGIEYALQSAFVTFSTTAGKPIFDFFKDAKREALDFMNTLNSDDAKMNGLRDALKRSAEYMGSLVRDGRAWLEGFDTSKAITSIQGLYATMGNVTQDMIIGGIIASLTTGHPYLGMAIAGALSAKGASISDAGSAVLALADSTIPAFQQGAEFAKSYEILGVQEEHKRLFGNRPSNVDIGRITEAGMARMREEITAQRELLAGASASRAVNDILARDAFVDSLVSGTYGSDLVAWDGRTARTAYGYEPKVEPEDPAEARRASSARTKAENARIRAARARQRDIDRQQRAIISSINSQFRRDSDAANLISAGAGNDLLLAQSSMEIAGARGASVPTMMNYQAMVNAKELAEIDARKQAASKLLSANDLRRRNLTPVLASDASKDVATKALEEIANIGQENFNIQQDLKDLDAERLATLRQQTAEMERQKRAQFDIADEVMGIISALRDGQKIGDIASSFFRRQTDQMMSNGIRDFFSRFGSSPQAPSGQFTTMQPGTGALMQSPGAAGSGGSGGSGAAASAAGSGVSAQALMTIGAGAISAGTGLARGIKQSQSAMYKSGSQRDAMAIQGITGALGMPSLGKGRSAGIAGAGLSGAAIGALAGGPLGAAIGGAIGLAVGGLVAAFTKKPSTNKLISKSLKKVYKELGLAYTGDFDSSNSGAFPELASMAGASAVQFGVSLTGKTIKPGRGSVSASNISNKILNDAAALRLGIEDTRERVREVNKALGGDFDSQANRLVAQRANRFEAGATLAGLPGDGGGSLGDVLLRRLKRSNAVKAGGRMSAAEIDKSFTDQLATVVDSFIELPDSVDKTRLSLIALAEDGTVSLTRLKSVAEDVASVIGGAIPGAVSALAKGDSLLSARDVMTQAFNDSMLSRAGEILQDSALTSSKFQDAVALGDKSLRAYAAGDFAGAERYAVEARNIMDMAATETARNLAPGTGALRVLGGSYGGGGMQLTSFGTDTMTVVPGGIGDPLLSVTHGGETVRNPDHEDKLQSGIEDLRSIMRDVRDILISSRGRGGSGMSPQTIRAEISVAEISDAQRASVTRQSSGRKTSNSNLGMP